MQTQFCSERFLQLDYLNSFQKAMLKILRGQPDPGSGTDGPSDTDRVEALYSFVDRVQVASTERIEEKSSAPQSE